MVQTNTFPAEDAGTKQEASRSDAGVSSECLSDQGFGQKQRSRQRSEPSQYREFIRRKQGRGQVKSHLCLAICQSASVRGAGADMQYAVLWRTASMDLLRHVDAWAGRLTGYFLTWSRGIWWCPVERGQPILAVVQVEAKQRLV